MSQEILYLSQQDVIDCGGLSMDNTINDLENLFRIQSMNDYLLPTKVVMKWPGKNSEETRGRINAMPAYVGGDVNLSGIKWIGSGPQNPFKYNLPRASALIILNNPETMLPIAVMDGTIISAMRTGGITGVCAKFAAPKNSKTVGVFGAGTQSRTQLMAIKSAISSVEKINVFDASFERSKKFALEMSKDLNIDVQAVKERKFAIKDADIIITATTATEPVVYGKEIEKGCYLAHIGGMEVDYDVIYNANKVIVDDWDAIKHRMGDTLSYMYCQKMITDEKIYANIEDLICGRKLGRENEDELIYSCNVGLGTYDITLASRVYKTALSLKKGKKLTLWENPIWV